MRQQGPAGAGRTYIFGLIQILCRCARGNVGWGLALPLFAAMGCGISFNTLPTVSLSPDTLSWHKVNIGNTSGIKTITVTNTSPAGAIPLKITAINLSANFLLQDTTCPITPKLLAPGDSCTISVAFRPQAPGDLTGTLTLEDNTFDGAASVSLTAVGGIGFLLFDPTSLDFPGVAANTVSQPQTATLTNEATTPVAIEQFTTSSHFSEGDNCPIAPNTLQPGGSCTVTVTFDPIAGGKATGAVNVEDNLGNTTQLYLSGSDQGRQNVGVLDFSPAGLLWGKVAVGSTSATKTITIKNSQSSAVNFSNIATGPDFTITSSTCSNSLGGGQSCALSIAFRPGKVGSITELLTFTDDAIGSPQAVSLRGTGILGDLLFTPAALSFAGVDPGQASPAQSATLTNETQGTLSLSSITVGGQFAQTNNCPSTMGPQASCTFQVTANPTAEGKITGSVNVKDDLGNSAQLYLKGQGGGVDQVLSFSPNPLVWGTIGVGQTSGPKTLTVSNGQAVPLTIYSISVGQDFIITSSNCPTAPETVPAGGSCTIPLAFRPYSAGAKDEVLTFTDDAPGGNQSVELQGTGTNGELLFRPASLSFAGVEPNTTSQPQTATLTNQQTSAVTLASITVSGHFAQTNNCPDTLAPQAGCTFTVTSNPVIEGPIEGAVNVKDGSGVTTQLYLSGMGGIPIDQGGSAGSQVTVSTTSLSMGKVMVGQTSGALSVKFSNNSRSPITLSNVSAGPDFHESANTCPSAPSSLAPGAACSISIAFRPQSEGAKRESIVFAEGGWRSVRSVAVSGTGFKGSLLFTPVSLSFPSPAEAGGPGATGVATLTNQLTTAITIQSIRATGSFVQTNDCPVSPDSLPAGTSCTLSIHPAPLSTGKLAGTVDVTDSSGAVTQLYLSGYEAGSSPVAGSPASMTWGK